MRSLLYVFAIDEMSPLILSREDYLAFADICFREFGDRVKKLDNIQ